MVAAPQSTTPQSTTPQSFPNERAFWLAWSKIEGIGPILQKRLQMAFGSLEQAWLASAADLLTVDGIGLLLVDTIVRKRSQLIPQAILTETEARNQSFWTPADPDYPQSLLELPDPPPVLFYRGQLRPNQLAQPAVAIVGTRDPSSYGIRWTCRLSACLAQRGLPVISGLAKGIDTYAHRSCLEHQGQTIAVLGTGVDVVYPWSNQLLYEQIAARGLLLSEYPDGTQPDRVHFPQRNRIIAGLSRVILVTEAPERSGALITAHLANDYGREVYALPGSLDNPRARGCLQLIAQGSQLVIDEASWLQSLSTLPPLAQGTPYVFPNAAPPPLTHRRPVKPGGKSAGEISPEPLPLSESVSLEGLDSLLKTTLQALSTDPMGLDTLVQNTQLETSTVLSSLLQLELLGLVSQLPGMQYQRCS